jgi:hypothetical protein
MKKALDSGIYYSLGRIYESMQDTGKTLENYNHYLRLDPDSSLRDKLIDRIRYYELHGKFPATGE